MMSTCVLYVSLVTQPLPAKGVPSQPLSVEQVLGDLPPP